MTSQYRDEYYPLDNATTAPEAGRSQSWPQGVPDPNPGWSRVFHAAALKSADVTRILPDDRSAPE